MTRQIKFRGRNKTGQWVYGYYVQHPAGIPFIVRYATSGAPEWHEVDSDTVGEYTGHHDANYKPIFEGDILNSRHFDNRMGIAHSVCEVVMTNGWWDCKTAKGLGDLLSCVLTFAPDTVIIGNVHDNPELMKGDDK